MPANLPPQYVKAKVKYRPATLPGCARRRSPIVGASSGGEAQLDSIRAVAYDLVGVIRIYAEIPARPADRSHPSAIPAGGAALGSAREIRRPSEPSPGFAEVGGRASPPAGPAGATTDSGIAA